MKIDVITYTITLIAKPDNVNEFLSPFVLELNSLLCDGLEVRDTKVRFTLRCFICDTPARAMVRCTVGHNGYQSCIKCTTDGEYSYSANCVIFPNISAPLRTDTDFRSGLYGDHHKKRSILESVIGLDMINGFPIGDVLHLIDLGVTKRLLHGWKTGNLNNFDANWSSDDIRIVSEYLVKTKMPNEIVRQPRGLDEIAFWKGAEYRTFLLYCSLAIVNDLFPSKGISEHFLNFYCAIVICSRHDQPRQNYSIAREMLADFLNGVKKLYGKDLFSSNMHNLCHLVDDVERFGPLDTFSAYSFESKLFTIKRLIRSGNLPLSQVARRVSEMQQTVKKRDIKREKFLRKYHVANNDLPSNLLSFMENMECDLYGCVQLSSFRLDCDSDADRWILQPNFKIFRVEYVIRCLSDGRICFYGRNLQKTTDYFIKPVKSSSLQIYASDLELETLSEIIPIDRVYCKMVKISQSVHSNSNKSSIFIPLIHTLLG